MEGAPFDDGGVQLPGRFTYEITVRTLNEQFLLRPDDEANELILGCLGRAAHRYPRLGLHAVNFLSNHATMLATPDHFATLSDFMRDLESTIANRINPHRGREGRFWSRRFRSIPAVDEAAVESKFRYVLTHGTKENLVWSADEWPGVHCIDALRGGKPLVGRWRDGTAENELRKQLHRKLKRAGRAAAEFQNVEVPEVWREYPIEFVPLPHWQKEKPGTIRQRVARIIRDDANETRKRHKRDGTEPLGRAGILATDPMARPSKPKKSPAPICHASTREGKRAYRRGYHAWAEMIAAANRGLLDRRAEAGYPASNTTGPLRSERVVVNRAEPAPVFVGGDPRLHYDPLLVHEPPEELLRRPRTTGPPE